jgi:glycosyltransferase involved in cell wall biosynthesis
MSVFTNGSLRSDAAELPGAKIVRLVYVFDAVLPSSMASAVNVVKTCAAMTAEGHQVTLVHFRGRGDAVEPYGVGPFTRLALPMDPRGRGAIRVLAWTAAILGRLTGALVYARKPSLLLPAARLGCPVAVELHAPVEPGTVQSHAAFDRLVTRKELRSIICISDALAARTARDWPQAQEHLVVAHDGADAGSTPDTPRSSSERPLLAYAGHLYPGKGMELIADLAKMRPDWDFRVIGGRPEDVRRWQIATGEPANIEFTGMVPHSKVAELLAGADILLAPYGRKVIVSDGRLDVAEWMSPLKMFEYMALAKPIVASDLPVLREVLRDGENARLAAAGEANDWERVISEILEDPAAASAMARRAREDLERNYSWRCRARAILSAIAR